MWTARACDEHVGLDTALHLRVDDSDGGRREEEDVARGGRRGVDSDVRDGRQELLDERLVLDERADEGDDTRDEGVKRFGLMQRSHQRDL